MKAYRCLTNKTGYHLTIGKIYLIKDYTTDKTNLIINDKGVEHFLFDDEMEDNFIDIEQEREDKLNKLLYE